jgi:hypothetical protein
VSSTRQLLVHLFRCTNNPQTCLPKTTCNTPQTEHTNSNTDTDTQTLTRIRIRKPRKRRTLTTNYRKYGG